MIERGEPSAAFEEIEGERFAVEPPTPFLLACRRRAVAALADALHEAPSLRLVAGQTLEIGGWRLRPELVLVDAREEQVRLVVEVRRESTDRFALGLKRLAYASARASAYWFVDPAARAVRVMRLPPGRRALEWPGALLRPGETIVEPLGDQRLVVRVADLLPESGALAVEARAERG